MKSIVYKQHTSTSWVLSIAYIVYVLCIWKNQFRARERS